MACNCAIPSKCVKHCTKLVNHQEQQTQESLPPVPLEASFETVPVNHQEQQTGESLPPSTFETAIETSSVDHQEQQINEFLPPPTFVRPLEALSVDHQEQQVNDILPPSTFVTPLETVPVLPQPAPPKKKYSKSPLILVLYTGGTIGMQPNEDDVLAPKALVFSQKIKEDGYLNDRALAEKCGIKEESDLLVTHSENLVIRYRIKEYSPLLDSSNLGINEWSYMAEDISNNYHSYDGFIILHGTDTLNYTSSALSFMLEGLQKPVIITGAQISIFMLRSDARNNIIGALVFAATGKIKEVCVYFNHKLIRGNRAVKFSADALEGFISPNSPLLAKLQLQIEESYRPPDFSTASEFRAITKLCPHVVLLPISPTITAELVEKILSEPTQGAVLLTFGAGNVPSNNESLISALKNAVDRGVIIVNVSQCLQATVSAIYETGQVLESTGVIGGYDMTTEAAFTKLCYVLALPISRNEKIEMMNTNLRGEFTVEDSRETEFSITNLQDDI